MTAAEKAKKRKRDKHAQFLVGAFSLEEARKDGTLEALKIKVAQSLKREADKQAVIMFGSDEASDSQEVKRLDKVLS